MLRTVHVSLNFNAHSTFNSDALFHCCKMFSGLSEIILNYYYTELTGVRVVRCVT